MKVPGPDHPITIEPVGGRVVVRFRGEVIAETVHALELREASYKPVLYIPRRDARMSHYERTTHSTHCPYKGDASYFDLMSSYASAHNAVWSYEAPFPAMTAIKDHLAFYLQHVSIEQRA
jgi:uncharacterized protein (DUF427 family)